MKPRLLDLFCGAGGSAAGYQRAGFYVVGVDIEPQPNYCGDEFHQADAMQVLAWIADGVLVSSERREIPLVFDAVHASPPCQAYSVTKGLHDTPYPELVDPIRERLTATGLPYVIENVVGAPLLSPIRLCGSSFGLGVRRHRLFETSPMLLMVPRCAHHLQPEPIDVTGTGGPCSKPRGGNGGIHRKPRNLAHARDVMGIDWMTRSELSEAVPPAFTEWIGLQLLDILERAA